MRYVLFFLILVLLPFSLFSQFVLETISISPDTLKIEKGKASILGHSIVIGVDSTNPNNWDGGVASTNLNLSNYSGSSYYALITISWNKRFEGLVSKNIDSIIRINVDDIPVWSIRSNFKDTSKSGNYFAVLDTQIVSSFKITQPQSQLKILVPQNCSFSISSIKIEIFTLDERIRGLCYSPFRNGQDPNYKKYPSQEQIRVDIKNYIQHKCNIFRTFSSTDSIYYIVPIANEFNISVCPGAYLAGYQSYEEKQKEIDSLISLANNNSNVKFVSVGNETNLTNIPIDTLKLYISKVRSKVKVPVTSNQLYSYWLDYPDLVDSVDFITAHFYPSWEGVDIKYALESIQFHYNNLLKKYPGKRIVIGETGWSSSGNNLGNAVLSLENARKFLKDFLRWTCENNIDFYYFEAFDEPWKAYHEEGLTGAHWGLLDSGRIGKYPEQTVLFCPSPEPQPPNDVKIINVKDNITTNIKKLPLIIEFSGNFRDTLSTYQLGFNFENLVEIILNGKRERVYCDALLSPRVNSLIVVCSLNNEKDSSLVNIYYNSLYTFNNRKLAYITTGNSILVSDVEIQTALGRIYLPFDDSAVVREIYNLNENYIIVVGTQGISILNSLTSKLINSIKISTSIYAAIDVNNYLIYFLSIDSSNEVVGIELDLISDNINIFRLDPLRINAFDINWQRCRIAIKDPLEINLLHLMPVGVLEI